MKLFATRKAQKQLDRLPKPLYSRLEKAIDNLAQNPYPHGCRKLTPFDEHRIGVGGYRILYQVDQKAKEITILRVLHRREVYRNL